VRRALAALTALVFTAIFAADAGGLLVGELGWQSTASTLSSHELSRLMLWLTKLLSGVKIETRDMGIQASLHLLPYKSAPALSTSITTLTVISCRHLGPLLQTLLMNTVHGFWAAAASTFGFYPI